MGKSWSDLVKALRNIESFHRTPLDPWIHLKEEKLTPLPVKELYGVKTVVYKQLADIPILLSGENPAGPKLRPEAEPFVPRSVLTSQAGEHQEHEDVHEDVPVEVDEDLDPDTNDEEADEETYLAEVALSIGNNRVEQVIPTEVEITAVLCIQKAYRRWARRRKVKAPSSSDARSRWFKACYTTSESLQFTVRYRVQFLGPLPHVMVSLDSAQTTIQSLKQKAFVRLRTAQHADLDDAKEQADKTRYGDLHWVSHHRS